MAEKITLEFDINANKADLTLGELRDGFKEMEEALEKTGRGSKQFKELTTAMAQTNREIKNMELSFEALDNEQVASEIGSVAGGITDVTASLVLMGGENENLQQMAEGIQTAMAVSMGFKGAIEGVSSGMKLYNNLLKTGKVQTLLMSAATKVAGVAQMAFNAIMSANPLGIIILAITGVIAAFVAFGGTIKKVMDFVLYPYIVIIDAIIAQLRWLGIMESETAKASSKASFKAAKDHAKASKERREETERLIAAHRKLTESMVNDMDFEVRKRAAAGKETTEIELEKLRFLIEAAKKEAELQKQKIADIKAENIARIKSGQFLGNELFNQFKSEQESLKIIKDSNQQQVQAEQDLEVMLIKIAKKGSDDRKAIKKKEFEERKAQDDIELVEKRRIKDEEIIIEEEKTNGLLAGILAVQEAEAKAAEQKQLNARLLKRIAIEEDEARQQQLDKAQSGLDILNNGADAFIKDEVKREKVKKKLAIAQLAIDTARSISAGIAAAAGIPFPGNIIAFAPTIAAILGNIAQAKNLLSSAGATSAGSLGSAGASSSSAGGGVGINPVSNTSTIIGDQTAVVEVVEINNKQKQVGVIEASATF